MITIMKEDRIMMKIDYFNKCTTENTFDSIVANIKAISHDQRWYSIQNKIPRATVERRYKYDIELSIHCAFLSSSSELYLCIYIHLYIHIYIYIYMNIYM